MKTHTITWKACSRLPFFLLLVVEILIGNPAHICTPNTFSSRIQKYRFLSFCLYSEYILITHKIYLFLSVCLYSEYVLITHKTCFSECLFVLRARSHHAQNICFSECLFVLRVHSTFSSCTKYIYIFFFFLLSSCGSSVYLPRADKTPENVSVGGETTRAERRPLGRSITFREIHPLKLLGRADGCDGEMAIHSLRRVVVVAFSSSPSVCPRVPALFPRGRHLVPGEVSGEVLAWSLQEQSCE